VPSRRPHRVRAAVSRRLERMIQRAVGPRIDDLARDVSGLADDLARQVTRLAGDVARVRDIAAGTHDAIPDLRRQLLVSRTTEEYEHALSDPEPLVTVRIPTYVRSKLLVERALPSVARQTYQHFEVIVVGDGCTNDTAERVAAFGDSRVRFVNLPFRFPYPQDPTQRWFVAGGPGVNAATQMANGTWLATLGDDDELEPHHLECLLDTARSTRSEMVYGKLLERRPPPSESIVRGSYPPQLGQFGFQAALVMRALRGFDFDAKSWMLDEPADWNLCRRMLEAGVHIGYVDCVVAHWYPSKAFEADGQAAGS
jgi:hypothetical protein